MEKLSRGTPLPNGHGRGMHRSFLSYVAVEVAVGVDGTVTLQRATVAADAGYALLARGEVRAAELSSQPAMQAQMLDVLGRLNM